MAIQFGQDLSNLMSNLMLQLLSGNGISVPTAFHAQAKAIEKIIGQDTSGLVSSLTSFQISCACVDTIIETGNDNLNEILNDKWLIKLNSKFRGQGIQTGLKGLMKEYFMERWQGASFPVLKIIKWDEIDGMSFPVSMIFVDGGSIYAKPEDKEKSQSLLGYRYFLGKECKEEIKGEAYLMYKLFVRWFKKYPVPYLIGRGIYKPWKALDALKNKQTQLLSQLIPYLLDVLEGSENLEINRQKNWDKNELLDVKQKIQELMDRLNKNSNEAPIRVSNWDEIIKHIIPDLKGMFDPTLGASSEEAILSALGFLNLSNPTTSRKENFLNPKSFIKETNDGISDFGLILKDLIDLIKEKNEDVDGENHRKYNSLEWKIVSAPMTDFYTEEFLKIMRNLRDKGIVSNETMDTVAGVDYGLEKIRRERELENGDDLLMLPPITQNQEDKGIDFRSKGNPEEGKIICECPKCGYQIDLPEGKHCKDIPCKKCKTPMRRLDRPGKGKENRNKDGDDKRNQTPDDKKDPTEKKNYSQASKMKITGAPYSTIRALPDYIQKLPVGKQRIWMRAWNYAWEKFKKLPEKKRESRCFTYANGVLKKISKGMRLTKAVLNKIFDEENYE